MLELPEKCAVSPNVTERLLCVGSHAASGGGANERNALCEMQGSSPFPRQGTYGISWSLWMSWESHDVAFF